MEQTLPSIPAKRYFTIGEVGELCGVKPHVLRYWEQEFTQLRPMKRRGNRRYYQHHEVLMIRRIRDLLYEQGFTISGARNKLQELVHAQRNARKQTSPELTDAEHAADNANALLEQAAMDLFNAPLAMANSHDLVGLRAELVRIRDILTLDL
jgi:DNA-binding transcriptional MerR regulator